MKFKTRTTIEITDKVLKVFQASLTGSNALTYAMIINIEGLSDEAIALRLTDLHKNKKLNLRSSQVILVIPRKDVILRYLDLPSENPEELKRMVDLQAVNHLPFSREEVVMDFLFLEKNGEGYTKVMILAVAKEIVVRFEKIAAGLNVSPDRISLSFIGIWQWYRRNRVADQGVTAIIDLDVDKTEICFCDHEKVLISRPTNLGIQEINNKEFDKFLEQLDWTIATYVKEQLGHPVDHILVLSSLDNTQELTSYLQTKYKATVAYMHTLKNPSNKRTIVLPKGLAQEGYSITALLGLLQNTNESSIDLTPIEVRKIQLAVSSKKQWVRFVIIVILAIVGLGLSLSVGFLKKNTQLSELEKEIKSTQKKVTLIQQKQKQVDALKGVIENRIVLVDVFTEIYQLLPEDIVLTNLTLSQEHILSLQGYSAKAADINDMQKAFVESSYFENVNLEFVNKRVTLDGEINYFKITGHIKIKGKSHEEVK